VASLRILLVCPDPKGLGTMAAALSGQFPVLAAHSTNDALALIKRFGPCDAAFCQVFDDPEAGVAFVNALCRASPGIIVIALTQLPCSRTILQAAQKGLVNSICLLPLSPELLSDKARHLLSARHRRHCLEVPSAHLTREEVDFLLGRCQPEHPRPPQASKVSAPS